MSSHRACNMELQHLDDVMVIEKLSFNTPWSREAFVTELTRNKCSLYRIIIADERIVAYGGMWILMNEVHITNIAVHPDYRGEGYGNKIVEDIIECARERGINSLTLEVRVSNYPAISLYEKYGFKEFAIRKGYYQDTGEDAIIMWKHEI